MKARGDAPWKGVKTGAFGLRHIEALLEGKAAFLHVPRFLKRSWCAEVSRRLLTSAPPVLQPHDYGTTRTLQLGLIHAASSEAGGYFDRSRGMARAVRSMYRGGEDPLIKLQAAIAKATAWKVKEARDRGRPYLTDMIMAFCPGHSSPPHCDVISGDGGSSRLKFRRQLSWNLFLSMCERGGSFAIYRRRHERGTALDLNGAPRAEIRPEIGDLILFDAGYYHEVRKTEGPTHRITAHSYIGVDTAGGAMSFWT